jgi:hypothetical protein
MISTLEVGFIGPWAPAKSFGFNILTSKSLGLKILRTVSCVFKILQGVREEGCIGYAGCSACEGVPKSIKLEP